MKSSEWLFEAEQNVKARKYLNNLSDADLDKAIAMVNSLVKEADDMPFDPRAKYKKTNKYFNAPKQDAGTKSTNLQPTSSKSTSTDKNNVEDLLKNLSEKDKERLVQMFQKEKVARKSKKTKSEPTASSTPKSANALSKIIVGLAVAIGALAAIPDDPKNLDQTTAQQKINIPDVKDFQKSYDLQFSKKLGKAEIISVVPKDLGFMLKTSNGNYLMAIKNNNIEGNYELRRYNLFAPDSEGLDPIKFVVIEDYSWWKTGFDNIMEADFTIANDNPFPIKDIQIECVHTAASGTKIDSNVRTIYDIIPANSSKKFKNFNMGFIHSQAESTHCKIISIKKGS